MGDYSAKAQELIGGARGRSASPTAVKKESVAALKSEDFPAAPKEAFKAATDAAPAPLVGDIASSLKEEEPLIST